MYSVYWRPTGKPRWMCLWGEKYPLNIARRIFQTHLLHGSQCGQRVELRPVGKSLPDPTQTAKNRRNLAYAEMLKAVDYPTLPFQRVRY